MARKTKEIRVSSGTPETNRDHGKVYAITEMSSYDAECWAADAFTGLVRAGVEVPDDLAGAGIVAIAQMGLKALGGIPKEDLRDLMDRMMACVTHYPDPAHREISRGATPPMSVAALGPMLSDDIEELSTRMLLRQEILLLHGSFLTAAAQSLGAPRATAPN